MDEKIEHIQLELNVKFDLQIVEAKGGYRVEQWLRIPGGHSQTAGFCKSYEEARSLMEAIQTLLTPVTIEGSYIDVNKILRGNDHDQKKSQ